MNAIENYDKLGQFETWMSHTLIAYPVTCFGTLLIVVICMALLFIEPRKKDSAVTSSET